MEVQEFGSSKIRCEDDVEAAEIKCFAVSHRHASGVEDLQEDIEHPRMRLLDFVEKQCAGRRLRDGESEQTDFAEFAAEQQAEAFLRLILRHIEAEEFVIAREVAGEGNGEFCFSNAGWTEKKETAARTSARGEAEFAPMQDGCDAREHMVLPANLLGEMRFEVTEVFETVG